MQRRLHLNVHAAPPLFGLQGQGGQALFQLVAPHLPGGLVHGHQLIEQLAGQQLAACRGPAHPAEGSAHPPCVQALLGALLAAQQAQQSLRLGVEGVPAVDKAERFAVAHGPLLLDLFQKAGNALHDILPPAAPDAEPQQRPPQSAQVQLRLQLHKTPGLVRFQAAVHLRHGAVLVDFNEPLGLMIRLRLLIPPLFAEQHLQTGHIAVFAGRRFPGKLAALHHAGDARQAGLFFGGRRGLFLCGLVVIRFQQKQRPDVLAGRALAVLVERTGAAGADEAAVGPQPDLGMVAVSATAPHVGLNVADAVVVDLAIEIFHPVAVCFGPRKNGAAQQIADLVPVHSCRPLSSAKCSIG